MRVVLVINMGKTIEFKWDLMVIYGDLWGFNGDLWGFNGFQYVLMGFNLSKN